ncbi:pectate lyase [Actinoalloteichus sp. AHMU CJ021]|uniref:Pectate lyase n=1 Tax=Actinoalloteichus caeruleus DSM 43889 TaxID=1120930 RepID=A0ABT1JFZ1_ACTCY|nr:right-handed parallel beta-helix repeat-containing protein [Actinoalloteichus caeruleus]AUS77530.1 pectate lyase [Actinoalloteichus sp. AHMU CJ021]MCP2331407.1 pectate lyase [Actinoalloteichus caeruleus DSM 43889]
MRKRLVGRRLVAAGALSALAVGSVLGGSVLAAAEPSEPWSAPYQDDRPIGWASVDENGQNGTTGGAGGDTVTASNADQFLDYISRDEPLVIEVDGTIQLSGMERVSSDKTIIGVGTNGHITGGGLKLRSVSNIIIRNLHFSDANDDSIDMEEGTHHVWVDHNSFTNANDGAVDIKRESDFITVSWNRVYEHDKSMILGHSDNHTADIGHLRVTYHHNYFDGSDTRHPRVRFGDQVHVFNNYYRANKEYGVASTMNAGVIVEGNYFEDVDTPTEVGYGSSSDGRIVARNNVLDNSGEIATAGSVDDPPYSYTVDNPQNIPSLVGGGAGYGNL